jgi:hypothetical protein
MKRIIFSILAVIALAIPVSAQLVEQETARPDMTLDAYGSSPAASPFSLLDLSRINWSHSYSVTYFSGGLGSGTLGLFTTRMAYEFSSKLSMNLNVGIAHNPGALWGDKKNNETQLLPGFLLDYHPSEKFRMSLGFQQYGGNYYNPYYYYNRGLFSDW